MKIIIAFLIALSIGAGTRFAKIPSLAPQAIVGALLVVAMSVGSVLADHYLTVSLSPMASASTTRRK
jgi:XapX domain-containing protein